MVGRHTSNTRSAARTDKGTLIGALLVVVVAVILAYGFVYLNQRRSELAQLDPSTLCPVKGPVAVESVLIDRTDPLTEIQLESLKDLITAQAEQVPKFGAFRVYEVGVGGSLLGPVLTVCNPGDGSDASVLDSNPAHLQKRYQQKFIGPVNTMLEQMRADHEQPSSPILEAVQAIGVRDFGERNNEGRLVIVSDLLQYGSGLNFYRGAPDAETFSRSPVGRNLHVNLAGVVTTIYLINRVKDAKYQTDSLGAFWIRWLGLQGAEVAAFKQL